MAAALAAYGGEPGGLRAGLFLGEAAAGCALSAPVTVGGFYLVVASSSLYGGGYDRIVEAEPYWPGVIIGNTLAFAYPFATTLGTMGIGERFGAPSANRRSAYLLPSFACVGAAVLFGFTGVAVFNDQDHFNRFWRGVFYGVVPNAFLNAYVYNRVKKPEADAASSRISATPYVTAYRVGRDEPTPVYGLTLSF